MDGSVFENKWPSANQNLKLFWCYMPLRTLCETCYNPAKSRCSLCKLTKYCDIKCQTEDAKNHKAICPVISKMDLEEQAWMKWCLLNREAMAKMVACDHVIELAFEEETVVVTEYSRSDYLARISADMCDQLFRVAALPSGPHVESLTDIKCPGYSIYRIKKIDTPNDVTHVDGVTVVPADWPADSGLIASQYSAGWRFEFLKAV